MPLRTLIGSLGISAMLLAGGCGQKGPLYLPDKNKSAVPPPAAAPAPVPAPATAPVTAPATAPETAPAPDKDSPDKNGADSGS